MPMTVPTKPCAKSSRAPPSDVFTATSATSKSSDVPTPKSRTVIASKMFCSRIVKLFPRAELPDFDHVKGKE